MKGETESGYIPLKIDKTFNIFINQVSFSKSKYFECFLSLNSCIWSWLNIANTLLVARCARFFVVPRRVAVLRDDILPAEIFQNQRLHIIFKSMFQIKFRDPFSELNGQKNRFWRNAFQVIFLCLQNVLLKKRFLAIIPYRGLITQVYKYIPLCIYDSQLQNYPI